MSKDIYNNSAFLGKSLYNLQPAGRVSESALSGFLNSFINDATTNGSSGAGDNVFGIVTADIINTNIMTSLEEISVGTGGLLRIIPLDQQKINDAFTYGVMVTTNLYSKQSDLASGYTSIKLDVPYVYNVPDHVLVVENKEAPDNFLEVSNSKFRVTGPFTFIKSTKTSIKSPIITLGYYDREESGFEGATTLVYKTYDKGIVMERVDDDNRNVDEIKFSYMGYSQNLGRFVMYNDGEYSGTDTYQYPKMDGTPGDQTATLTEYNISRNPYTVGDTAGTSVLEVDTIYVNNIIASDHTTSRKLNLNSYDTMTIEVNRAVGDTDPDKNFDLLLNVGGKIIINSSGEGTTQTSVNDYRIQSETGTFINAYNPDNPGYIGVPVYIGYGSIVSVDNYLKTTYISTGVNTRNRDTMIEFGGNFTATDGAGVGSKLLIDGSVTGETNNDIHVLYSDPTINVPAGGNNVNYVSNTTLQPPTLNIGTSSSVNTSSTLHITGATTGATNNYALLTSAGEARFLGSQSTGAYMSWDNDALKLFNSRLYINSELSGLPVLSLGEPGFETNFFTIKRSNVDGANELFSDNAATTRIALADNKTYTVIGTVTATQGTLSAHFEIKYCLTIANGIKTCKYDILNKLYSDLDGEADIFDVTVGYSGDIANFASGDGLTVTGTNTNNTNTNWFAILEVTELTKP